MPSWKKVITSGSSAAFSSLIVSNTITGSISGSLTGSLQGTADNAVNAGSADYIASSNVDGPFGFDSISTASLATTASSIYTDTGIGAIYENIDDASLNIISTNRINITGSVTFNIAPTLPNTTYNITASLAQTASYAINAENAINADTASYTQQAQLALAVTTSVSVPPTISLLYQSQNQTNSPVYQGGGTFMTYDSGTKKFYLGDDVILESDNYIILSSSNTPPSFTPYNGATMLASGSGDN